MMGDGIMGDGMFSPMMLMMLLFALVVLAALALAIVAVSRRGHERGQVHRSSRHQVLAGVAGGIAEHFGISPMVVRVVWVLALLVPMTTLVALGLYLVLALALPSEAAEA